MIASLWSILEQLVRPDVTGKKFSLPFWDMRKILLKNYWLMELSGKIIGLIAKIEF
jgi:hypothetical protein